MDLGKGKNESRESASPLKWAGSELEALCSSVAELIEGHQELEELVRSLASSRLKKLLVDKEEPFGSGQSYPSGCQGRVVSASFSPSEANILRASAVELQEAICQLRQVIEESTKAVVERMSSGGMVSSSSGEYGKAARARQLHQLQKQQDELRAQCERLELQLAEKTKQVAHLEQQLEEQNRQMARQQEQWATILQILKPLIDGVFAYWAEALGVEEGFSGRFPAEAPQELSENILSLPFVMKKTSAG